MSALLGPLQIGPASCHAVACDETLNIAKYFLNCTLTYFMCLVTGLSAVRMIEESILSCASRNMKRCCKNIVERTLEICDRSDYLQFTDDLRQRTPSERAMCWTVFVPMQTSYLSFMGAA